MVNNVRKLTGENRKNYDDIEKAIECLWRDGRSKTKKKAVRSVSQGGDRDSDSLSGSINWQ